jgi:hypothetical protein
MSSLSRSLLHSTDSEGYITWKQAYRFAQRFDWYDEFVEAFAACSYGNKVYAQDLLEWAGF